MTKEELQQKIDDRERWKNRYHSVDTFSQEQYEKAADRIIGHVLGNTEYRLPLPMEDLLDICNPVIVNKEITNESEKSL